MAEECAAHAQPPAEVAGVDECAWEARSAAKALSRDATRDVAAGLRRCLCKRTVEASQESYARRSVSW